MTQVMTRNIITSKMSVEKFTKLACDHKKIKGFEAVEKLETELRFAQEVLLN
jgi:hypothetical protein